MRRAEIIAAATNVVAILQDSGLQELAQKPRGELRGEKPALLGIFRKFVTSSARLGAAELEFLNIFGLSPLEEMEFWETFIDSAWEDPETNVIRVRINQFSQYVPRLVRMLENDALRARAAVEKNRAADAAVLTAVLLEGPAEASKPARIVDAIRSIVGLYEVCAFLSNTDPDALAVIGCDSGSDKSFDFLGAASAIAGLKELILGIWDRIVFHRQTQNEANIVQALKSLTAAEQISRLEADGTLEHEPAERLRHQLIANASMFVNCGITIPELVAHTTHDPRKLMAPQPKLITGNIDSRHDSEPESATPAPGDPGFDPVSLTDDERVILQRLLDRERASPRGDSK